MALPSINTSDFVGEIQLSQISYQQNGLQLAIDEQYPRFVRAVIGDEAYNTVRNQDPLEQKWVDLFNETYYFNTEQDKNLLHSGLRFCARYVIYYHYLSDYAQVASPVGKVRNNNENSTNINAAPYANSRFNKAVRVLLEEVYPFIKNYEKLSVDIASSVEVAGTYTLGVSDTTYLVNGDTVTINGTEYTVSNVVANTSFDITTTTGLDFTGDTATYEPYKDFPLHHFFPNLF